MLLGQSLFQSVLTRLDDERQDAEQAPPEAVDFRIRGLGAGFVTPEGRPAVTDADTDAYFDHLADWLDQQPAAELPSGDDAHKQAEAAVMPPHLQRLTEVEIAQDLAISPKDNETTLNEKRRQFAKLNHPDRVLPEFRENATTRMKIANLLIDRALQSYG